MDVTGARILAARLEAGVGIGTMIELTSDSAEDSRLVPGDRGVVDELKQNGNIVVRWESGLKKEIHPSSSTYRALGITSRETA